MNKFIFQFIRILISSGKFIFMIYTVSAINFYPTITADINYLQSGHITLEFNKVFNQDRVNSNIRRRNFENFS